MVVVGILFVVASLSGSQPAYADDSSPVLYFYSAQCSHCRAMTPILVELAAQGYRVKVIDVIKNPGAWQQYNIDGTPAWIAANGDRLSGEQNKLVLENWLASHGAKIR